MPTKRSHFRVGYFVATLLFGIAPVATLAAQATQDDKAVLAAEAQKILAENCYGCHGQNGTNEGGFNFVLPLERLVAGGKFIKPGSADDSYLLERILDGEMPPKGKTPRPSKEDVATLSRWIAAGHPI